MKKSNWKYKYKKYILCPINEDDSLYGKKSKELISKNAPKKLYKYRMFNDSSIENLKNNTLWFNLPKNFNDPYDFGVFMSNDGIIRYNINKDKEFKEIYDKYMEIYKENSTILKSMGDIVNPIIDNDKGKLKQMFEDFRDHICICSLSEVNDSLLMWSHYTNSHSGFCIEYDFTQINNVCSELHPVFYDNKIIDITQYYKYKNQDLFKVAILNKSTEWSYENEWRIVEYNSITEGMSINVPKPIALYFGCNMLPEHICMLSEIADKLNIDKYVMEMKEDEYKLVPKKI
ncbi:hypothetical protein CF050_15760 [Clostridium botulinum]|uniref:DUF2971 domain-containing protein n=1 Tax=Clostridium botulinum TaxID=1491 RepID=UPI001969AD0B|nr:DUF2971 domain-containing protein [Clostridium botulinum]MBN3348292.1 hypothetical protein [Clostridium botulinum]